MSSSTVEAHESAPGQNRPSLALGVVGVTIVAVAGIVKCLLFRNLEYGGTDLYSFLEMSRGWAFGRPLLYENVYGFHGAIHNSYLLPVLAFLTIPLGAYGLILFLTLAHGAGVARVAGSRRLHPTARLAILAGALGPLAFYVFDNTQWGFHPELLYPPLSLLLAVELLEGWTWRSIAVASTLVLVKEDGAVVCAAVVLAHTAWRAGTLPSEERRRALRSGAIALLVLFGVFLAGMALLTVVGRLSPAAQVTSSARLTESLDLVWRTLTGRGHVRIARLRDVGRAYAVMCALMLLPLGARIGRGLLILACAAPPILAVLLVSAAGYRFSMMLWAPRVATLQAAVFASIVYASATYPDRRPPRAAVVAVLALVAWAAQAVLLGSMRYSPWPRVEMAVQGRPRDSELTRTELAYLRCVAGRLPSGLPVSAADRTYPLFHRQSIVFEKRASIAWHAPRLRVVDASQDSAPGRGTPCRGPTVGSYAVEAECDLLPSIADCAR